MKQLTQNLRTGKLSLDEVPLPLLQEPGILVRNRVSLISVGTERSMLRLAKKTLVGKARQRPDLVRKVLDKVRREGILATVKTVRQKLDSDVPMGYSACGEVIEVGARAGQFEAGERVACAGAGYANHAEVNYVPRLLAAQVPAGVSTEAAAYATVGAVALHGIRNADVHAGETVAVLGLGLIGQLTVQLLKASGCRVVGLDFVAERAELATSCGADLALVIDGDRSDNRVLQFTRGRGADAVLITAATESSAPIEHAGRLARDRARVVQVGVTGADIPRKLYFEKELDFRISRSYGPGRYDPQYEEHGHDYPAGYVRWTENRNIEAFLDLVDAGGVRPEACTTHRFEITDAEAAYEMILTNREPHLGVVLTYPDDPSGKPAAETIRIELRTPAAAKAVDTVGVSFIGAGDFARSTHLPNMAKVPNAVLRGLVDATGIAARSAGTKHGFAFCTSAEKEVFDDEQTNLLIVTTPHSQHADTICRALEAGKSVFVEKPLAIDVEQLGRVRRALDAHPHGLMVGFNRRFAPLAAELKEFVRGRGPLTVHYRCNAGPLPEGHWIADPAEGGRIIGEACHFFDFFAYLTGARPKTVFAAAPSTGSTDDSAVTIAYDDGSVCQLLYTSQGAPSFSKERLEVFAGGSVAVLEDFRTLYLQPGSGKRKRRRRFQADKGHLAELKQVVEAIRKGQPMPIAVDSLFDTTLTSFAAVAAVQRQQPLALSELWAELDKQ